MDLLRDLLKIEEGHMPDFRSMSDEQLMDICAELEMEDLCVLDDDGKIVNREELIRDLEAGHGEIDMEDDLGTANEPIQRNLPFPGKMDQQEPDFDKEAALRSNLKAPREPQRDLPFECTVMSKGKKVKTFDTMTQAEEYLKSHKGEKLTIKEMAMPAGVIKQKQRIANMSEEDRKAYFMYMEKDKAARMERRLCVKPGSYTKYVSEEPIKEAVGMDKRAILDDFVGNVSEIFTDYTHHGIVERIPGILRQEIARTMRQGISPTAMNRAFNQAVTGDEGWSFDDVKTFARVFQRVTKTKFVAPRISVTEGKKTKFSTYTNIRSSFDYLKPVKVKKAVKEAETVKFKQPANPKKKVPLPAYGGLQKDMKNKTAAQAIEDEIGDKGLKGMTKKDRPFNSKERPSFKDWLTGNMVFDMTPSGELAGSMKLGEMEDKEPQHPSMPVFFVYVPANIYDGKYYDYRTVRVPVAAKNEEEANKIINDNKEVVLAHLDKKRMRSGQRTVRYVGRPIEKNVFFRPDNFTKPAREGDQVIALTGNGTFEKVNAGPTTSSRNVSPSPYGEIRKSMVGEASKDFKRAEKAVDKLAADKKKTDKKQTGVRLKDIKKDIEKSKKDVEEESKTMLRLRDILGEKWAHEYHTPESKKGMWDGWTKAELEAELSKLKKTGPHAKGSSEYTKEKEINFALRAKSGWKSE